MVGNQGQITKLAGTPNSGLIDGTDSIHTGVVKALQSFNKGDICIGHAGFTITGAGTYTQYNLAQPIHFIANNKYTTHGVTLTEAYVVGHAPIQNASHTRYDWVLLNPATPELIIVQGTAATVPLVADITAGHIPIALVQITSSGTDDPDKFDYSFQLFTLDKQDNSLSIGYDGGAYYIETLSITESGTADNTIESKVADKDIIFKVNDSDGGGAAIEVMRLDGSASALKMASGKQIQFGDSGEFISGDGTDLTIMSSGDISLNPTGGDISVIDLSASPSKPTLTLKNVANDATASQLILLSQRGMAAAVAVDGDDLGYIYFNGYDDDSGGPNPNTQTYGTILGEIADSASGAELGKMKMSVATHNGSAVAVTEALTIEGSVDAAGSNHFAKIGILQSAPKSALHVGGSISLPVYYQTSSATPLPVTEFHHTIIINNVATIELDLPPLATVGDGRVYHVSSLAGAVNIDPNGTENFNLTSTTFAMGPGEWVQFIAVSATGWFLTGKGTLL